MSALGVKKYFKMDPPRLQTQGSFVGSKRNREFDVSSLGGGGDEEEEPLELTQNPDAGAPAGVSYEEEARNSPARNNTPGGVTPGFGVEAVAHEAMSGGESSPYVSRATGQFSKTYSGGGGASPFAPSRLRSP